MGLSNPNSKSLYLYSLGIVVKDKEEGSDIITAHLVEDFPLSLGEIGADVRKKYSSLPTAAGVKKSSTIEGSTVVSAKWIPLGQPNRDNSPDVYRTQTVAIYRYADTQDFYWTTLFREPKFQRLERIRINASNIDASKDAPGNSSFDSDSSYWIEIDTLHKRFQVHTSSNDGEPTSFDLIIDTKAGTCVFQDELGNDFYLDSQAGTFEANIKESITWNTRRVIMNVEESFELNTKTATVEADNANFDAVINATKGMSIDTSKGGAGNTINMKGNIEIDGNVHATGTIVDDSGNTPHHSHD